MNAAADIARYERGTSLWQDAWRRLRRNRLAVFGAVTLVIIGALCVFAPWLSRYGYEQQDLVLGAAPPSGQHWLGTDTFGRDLLTRILYGGRISLMVGIIATSVALLIGVTWGAIAGYVAGRTDAVMMRIVDILYALPFMIFVLLLMVVFGGIGHIWGGVIGAIIVTIIDDLTRDYYQYRMAMFGSVIVLTVMFMPKGIGGIIDHFLVRRRFKAIRQRRADLNLAAESKRAAESKAD